jgi:hypothetical protein
MSGRLKKCQNFIVKVKGVLTDENAFFWKPCQIFVVQGNMEIGNIYKIWSTGAKMGIPEQSTCKSTVRQAFLMILREQSA